ncbi:MULTISPECIES: NUDIX hydrolase [Paraburkholderia]|uniref:ADP-ribose pyrophosphatase n=1 Tax=Paraburkholderia dioscoreae TaxID=2604047 RepID=A0A5Q4ZE42_9BURK|nr:MULTISPECIES: NUDIX hydrolase [Paraburkholderia]MDR8398561.1 NUDIX domain-containing protein [Paraburkholderia sp. USG1]VVD28982.1 ADP-ribose pyrophosphatase [Paraburkholderia dioscoreae]
MKDRSTVICIRDGRILLVARTRLAWPSRWSLPGGTIKISESPLEAALRELKEETSIVQSRLDYLFQFGGLAKRHHVFVADLAPDVSPEPCNEISRCDWFSPTEIAALPASIPTRAIVELFLSWHGAKVMRGEQC